MLHLEGRARRGAFALRAAVSVDEGARVAVMGPSGSGKSTLLEVVAGFVPFDGRVAWRGRPLDGPPGKRPVAVLFQDGNLFPHLTLERNLALGIRPSGRLSRAEREAVGAALGRVGLGGFGPRRPAALSGGQRGRAALARVLLMRRDLLLLDEPFAALGPALKAEMTGLVREVAAEIGATVLMVTHDPADARALGGSILLVDEGEVGPPASAEAVLADPPPALRRYLGEGPSPPGPP